MKNSRRRAGGLVVMGLALSALCGCENERCKLPEGVAPSMVTELRSAVAAARGGDNGNLEAAVARWSELPVERTDSWITIAGEIVEASQGMKRTLESGKAPAKDASSARNYGRSMDFGLTSLDDSTARFIDMCE